MKLSLLDRHTANAFRHMTFPAHRGWLSFDPALPVPIALGALEEDHPVGLALAIVEPDSHPAQLLSLYVEPKSRGRGIATQLLARIDTELARVGASEVTATYMTGQPSTPALETVLRKRAWSDPEPRMLVVHCSLESVRNAPWIKRYPLPEGWKIVPWVEIGDAMREEIRRTQEMDPWIPPDLVPFRHEEALEPVTSLALVVEDVVRGWVLNHVVDGVLRFTCSFVHRDLQRMARVLLLYNESVARAPQIGMSQGMWTIPLAHEGMVRFAQRWMQPYSTFFGETRGVGKRLSTGVPR